jgi:hypothetical protein
MDFSFGILTSKDSEEYLNKIVESIVDQNIPNYEIIIIGNTTEVFDKNINIIKINFNEDEKKGWITKKKNLITENANFENIVYLHDYLILNKNWYEGFLNFKEDFKVCTNKIVTKDNQRYRDWTLWQLNNNKFDQYLNRTRRCLLPYDVTNLTKYMYISGAYWVAKKDFMINNKLNENLLWGEGEDVEWSKRIRKKTKFKFNQFSTVQILKDKETIYTEIDQTTLKMLLDYNDKLSSRILDKSKIYFKKLLVKLKND